MFDLTFPLPPQDYKANRPRIDDALSWQIEQVPALLEAMGIPVVLRKGASHPPLSLDLMSSPTSHIYHTTHVHPFSLPQSLSHPPLTHL